MKHKGSNAERELVAMFWESGWAALRIAGSGRMNFPAVDVLAGNGQRIIAVECKSTKGQYQYFETEQISQLAEFSQGFGAEPKVGVKFSSEWRFYSPRDLRKTPSGQLVINKKDNNFKSFSELISN